MKRTIHINLGGHPFVIDEDAFEALEKYIDNLRIHFKRSDGSGEIIEDIEDGLAHILVTRLGKRKIVSLVDVRKAIERMGMPDDFDTGESGTYFKGEEAEQRAHPRDHDYRSPKKLYRDVDNRFIAGVCAGIARYFDVPVWLVRVIFFIGLVPGVGSPLVFYILLWFLIPPASTRAEKMRMQGSDITLENIVSRAEQEIRDLADRFTEWTEQKINKRR